jgi:hypothetical protein
MSLTDPDPGSGAFLPLDPDPGGVLFQIPDLESRKPTHIYESLVTIFWVKNT